MNALNHPALIALLQNAALLLALVVVFDLAAGRLPMRGRPLRQIAVGVLLGSLCVALIATAFRLESGIVFDTRSVLLSVSGLFFGALPTGVAMAIAAAFRLFKGGVGAWTGVSVTLATGAIGIAWRHLRKGRLQDVSARELYAFGIAVHLVMLAQMLTLPWASARHVLREISLPVLLVYPVAATALGLLLANRLRREQVAADLAASEERFRALFESSGVVMLVIDPDSGRIVEANRAAAEFYGHSCAQLAAMNIADINQLPPSQVAAECRRAQQTDRSFFVFPHRLANGDVHTVEVHSHPIVRDGQILLFSIVFDVTERRQSEVQIKEAKELLDRIIDHSPFAMWVADREGTVLRVNRSLCESLRLAPDQIVGHYNVFKDANLKEQGVMPRVRAVFAALEPARFEIPWRPARVNEVDFRGAREVTIDVCMFPVLNARGELAHVVCQWVDVTARKQTEAALRESEERFRTLVDGAPEGIFVQADGRFLFVNPAMASMLGAEKPEALVGTDILPLMAPEYHEAIRQRIRHQLETGGAAPPMEQDYLRLDGTRFPVETTAVPVRYAGRDAHLVFVRDVAERRRIEAEKQNLQAQLVHAQKMDSIGRLAGGVAHDFNNMLGVILGHAEIVLDKTPPSAPHFNSLQEIRKAAIRSGDLTRQLLAFARKQTVAPKALDLNETVEGMLAMLRRLIGENVELAWQPCATPARVKMDPSQIDQILANLCVNARDAIGDHGRVAIATGLAAFDEDYCASHAGFVPGDYVMLAVEDNGCGMDAETLLRLFEPFFTTKEVGKGTGLGLATVYGIVKQNNGFIDVDSAVGRGSTFRIYLPRLREAPPPAPPATPPPLPAGHETILLAEDDPALLKMTRLMLERIGYQVLPAASPEEALRLARQNAGRIDLLMTDVVMPGMNGRHLSQTLLAEQPRLKRLFMSGYTADVIARHGVLEPGVHFIAKPFTPAELAHQLRKILGADSPAAPRA